MDARFGIFSGLSCPGDNRRKDIGLPSASWYGMFLKMEIAPEIATVLPLSSLF